MIDEKAEWKAAEVGKRFGLPTNQTYLILEAYESAKEPVSLEKCAAAIKSFRDPSGHDSKRIAKAVLDELIKQGAGIRYAD